jgi:hypothetical protein
MGFGMPKHSETQTVLTANRTEDGSVVYLGVDRRWTRDLQEGCRLKADDQEAVLDWAKTQEREVCDPYVIDVVVDDGRLSPRTARERIRAEGPDATLARLGYAVSPVAPAALSRAAQG